MDIGRARNGGRLFHRLAASYRRIEEYYRGKAIAERDLPDIDLEGRVVIMTGANRGLGRAMSLGRSTITLAISSRRAFLLPKFFCAGTRSTSRASNQRRGGDLFHIPANILRRSMKRFIQLGFGPWLRSGLCGFGRQKI
jgi:hypothetical protein